MAGFNDLLFKNLIKIDTEIAKDIAKSIENMEINLFTKDAKIPNLFGGFDVENGNQFFFAFFGSRAFVCIVGAILLSFRGIFLQLAKNAAPCHFLHSL